MVEISPQAQHTLMQLQQYQQQLKLLMTQRQQIELQLAELDSALEALKDVKDDTVFKSVGPILAKVEKKNMESELKKSKELFELRIKTVEKQEEKVKAKIKETNDKLASELPSAG